MHPQTIRLISGQPATAHLSRVGRWIVANLRQQIGWTKHTLLVEFRGHLIALMPEEDDKYPAVAVDVPPDMTDDQARTLIQHFLSSLAWAKSAPVTVESWTGGGRPHRLSRSNFGQVRGVGFHIDYLPDPNTPQARLALAFFREGMGLKHNAYAFLSFYKIINLVHNGGNEQKAWIASKLHRLWDHKAKERLDALSSELEDVALYLYKSGRCAIAHAGTDPTVDPENVEDARRLALDLPLMRNLAEILVEDELGIETADTMYTEHKYELGGFCKLFGAELASRLRGGGSEFRRKFPPLPLLEIRLRGHEEYPFLQAMTGAVIKAADGVVGLECTSHSMRLRVAFALNFPAERLAFDPTRAMSALDDGTEEAASETADQHRFLADYYSNGQLEIWADGDGLLSRCDTFIPVNIDIGRTRSHLLGLEAELRAVAEMRRSVRTAATN